MAKKVFTDESLETLIDETKSYVDSAVSKKANSSHTHSISNITNLQSTLDGKVPTSRTVNGKALSSNITLSASDVGAAASSHSHSSYVNQNAFSNVKVGDTTISADTTTDTLNLVAGSNVTITPDATNDKITISAKDTTYNLGSFGITATASELNKLDGVTATTAELNYVDGVTSNIQTQLDGKSSTSHTHNYAGSSSVGGAATSANKVNNSLTVKLNGGTTEGTNLFTFNGSSAKSVNITPSSIGASTSSHNHDDRYYTETEVDTKLSGKANTSHGNHVPATQTASNKVFLRNDNTWATVTPANIGAAASSHTHKVANISDLTATATELNYMDGVTSNVQTQLDGKAASSHGTHVTWATSVPKANGTAAVGTVARVAREDHVHPLQTTISGNAGSATTISKRIIITSSKDTNAGKYIKFGRITLSSTYASFNGYLMFNPSETAGGATGLLHLHIRNGSSVSSTSCSIKWLTLNSADYETNVVVSKVSDGVFDIYYKPINTWDTMEIIVIAGSHHSTLALANSDTYVSSVTATYTSSLGGRVSYANSATTATSATKATQDASGNTITSTYATKSELNTAKSNLQASIDAKQATITGGASTITGSNLTTNRALISNGSGKVAVSAVTSTELGYLDGVTSSVQTQLNDKAPIANGQYAVTTAGTGAAYTATVPSIKSLTAGVSFIMIPNTVSTTTAPTLNVNSLGAKSIKRRLSNLPTSLQNGYSNAWLAQGKPFRVVYDGTAWIVEGHEKPSAADLYGLTATITELNYCDGVTSSIQTQLNALSSRIAALETILANDVLAINV